MPARIDTDWKSRRAAELYLDEGVEISALVERLGIGRTLISAAIKRLRDERGIAGPRSRP